MSNGVDLAFFDPERAHETPYAQGRRALVFTGAMDYRPNIDAVRWFASAVMPALRDAAPALDFWIVGSHPAPEVRALARQPGIHVTGGVPDVRPYIAHAEAVVAPLRIARGIQNKVLEGMAMAKPVIATPEAQEGLAVRDGEEILTATTPSDFVEGVRRVLDGAAPGIGRRARERVAADYRWEGNLRILDMLLGDGQREAARAGERSASSAIPSLSEP